MRRNEHISSSPARSPFGRSGFLIHLKFDTMPLFGFNRLKKSAKKVSKSVLKNVAETGETKLDVKLQGVINANVLNIRSAPTLNSQKLGKFTKGALISILEHVDNEWYRFKYNNQDAYVYAKFVSIVKGLINANVLNIRQGPSTKDQVVGQLKRNDVVTVAHIQDKWHKIIYDESFAYVYAKYVTLIYDTESAGTSESKLLKDNALLLNVKTEPDKKISVPSSPRSKRITAETYNNFGNLTDVISKQLKIDPAAAIAVLAVESAGKAYGDDGRVLIRFENHLFYRFWGKRNLDVFNDHFKFDRRKYWTNHFFRSNKKAEWENFHGNQKKEWEVFEFAQKLDSTAAHISASYGAPQILGTNYKKIGYDSPEKLLENFSDDVRFQVFALFDFFSPQMIKHVQNKDFTSFARYYNGAGQAVRYGNYIKDFYNAFKSLT
jgi:uncharacterized protein YgiM (DUF1202 family)